MKGYYNMEPKNPIIIDGVDVSGCLFYQANVEEDYNVKIKNYCSNWQNSCESNNNSNCYFKQLARKERECQRTEQKLTLIRDFITDTQIYNIAHSICDKILKIIDEVNADGRK